jgi:hypothetical protein
MKCCGSWLEGRAFNGRNRRTDSGPCSPETVDRRFEDKTNILSSGSSQIRGTSDFFQREPPFQRRTAERRYENVSMSQPSTSSSSCPISDALTHNYPPRILIPEVIPLANTGPGDKLIPQLPPPAHFSASSHTRISQYLLESGTLRRQFLVGCPFVNRYYHEEQPIARLRHSRSFMREERVTRTSPGA